MPKKLPKGADLLEEFKSLSIAQLAEKYNVKPETVQRKITALLASGENLTSEHQQKIEAIKQLRGEGKNWAQIAKILNVNQGSLYTFARTHGLHLVPTSFALGIPIGCPKCITNPYSKNLCLTCHSRLNRRIQNKQIEIPREFVLVESEHYKVICTPRRKQAKFTIYVSFLGTTIIQKPTPLETFLLNHLFRDFLINLDREALLKAYDALVSDEEDRNENATA
jgi:hypothetical protein